MNADTPRTDAAIQGPLPSEYISVEFCRKLERENTYLHAKWRSDQRLLKGALRLLDQEGFAPDSATLIAAAEASNPAVCHRPKGCVNEAGCAAKKYCLYGLAMEIKALHTPGPAPDHDDE